MNRLFVNMEKNASLLIKRLICLTHEDNCECEACKRFDSNSNPDVLIIDALNDESVPAKDFRHMIDSFYLKSINLSSAKVLFIKNLEHLSVVNQNVLLKNIEDSNNKVNFIATCKNRDKVLSTVQSRMSVVAGKSQMSFDEFEKYCFSKCIGESGLYYAVTGGDVSRLDDAMNNFGIWHGLIKTVPIKEDMREVFKTLNLIKEKQKTIADKGKEDVLILLNFFSVVYLNCLFLINGDKTDFAIEKTTFSKKELKRNIDKLSEVMSEVKEGYPFKTKDLASLMIQLYA